MAAVEVAVIARRRRFSFEQKLQFLEEAERTSMAAVARRHGLARSLLQRWKEKMLPVVTRGASQPFVRLTPAPEVAEQAAAIYLHVDAAIVIELPASADPQQIAALVFALRR